MDTSVALMVGGTAVSVLAVIHETFSSRVLRNAIAAVGVVLLLAPALAAYAEVTPPARRLASSAVVSDATVETPLRDLYTVQKGDTLWKIASRDLASRSGDTTPEAISDRWVGIYGTNLSVIGDDPNLIYPGQRYDMGEGR